MSAAFVSELIRAANETERLTKPERAQLLERAANMIADYRIEFAFSGTPANSQPGDIEYDLREMARLVALFSAEEVSGRLLRAAKIIKDLRTLLDMKEEILAEDSETEGSA